jgi:hypothetical protein
LNRIQVTPVLLKGAANLLRHLYADPAMRVMVDLDVLVPAERIDESAACLSYLGYHPLTEYRHPKKHHYPLLGRPGSPLPIELHYEVLAYPHGALLTANEVRASAVLLAGHSAQIAVASAMHSVIHNVAHAQLSNHDYLYGHFDLRSLFDFALLYRAYAQDIDWNNVNKRFVSHRDGVALNFHLLCGENLLGVQIPGRKIGDLISRLLFRRAAYLISRPKMFDVGVRLVRPWLLLRRETSDAQLRRRLARNLIDQTWWTRHMRRLTGRQ